MTWTIDKFDSKMEKDITTAMVMSDDFLHCIVPVYNDRYMRNKYSQIVCRWCIDYYEKYKEAPRQQIQNIYESYGRNGNIDSDALKLIGRFLKELSDEYVREDKFNHQYVQDQAIEFFDKRSLELLKDDLSELLEMKEYRKADAVISSYKQIPKVSIEGVNLTKSFITRIFEQKEEPLFTLPYSLGILLGEFYRDDFVAVAGPMKRGKTWALQYLAIEALSQKLNVAFFSMGDMSETQLGERFIRAFCNKPKRDDTCFIPVFDCADNQNDNCKLNKRLGKGRLKTIDQNWTPCTVCMGQPRFYPTSWLVEHEMKGMTLKDALKKVSALKRHFPGKLMIKAWPRKTGGISDIESTLKIWEWTDGFVPDVIITDYADIMRTEFKVSEYRHQLDHIWGEHDAMAKSRHCVVITGTQTVRGTLSGKRDVDVEDTAEDIRKMAHVSMMFSLNQSTDDKQNQIMRIKTMVSRHDKFLPETQVVILQNLDCAQFHLDSCIDLSIKKKQEKKHV